MQDQPLLTRRRARDEVRQLLKTLIADRSLPGGARLDEEGLSRRIGVSRTPLREALIALEGEGLVRSEPNKGFTVAAPSEAMVRELFPILAALEAAAVRLAGPRLTAKADHLREINIALARAKRPAQQYDLDAAFHRALTEECGNPRLLALLETHRAQARLFDGAHTKGLADQSGSCREHDDIIAAIEKGKLAKAADLLIAHWRRGEDVVAAWMQDQK